MQPSTAMPPTTQGIGVRKVRGASGARRRMTSMHTDTAVNAASVPAFASAEMRGIVDAARRDAASLIPNLASPPSQLSTWITGLEGQTAEARASQAGAELVYQQFSTSPALSGLCQRAALAPSGVDLLDSIAIAWGGTRVLIAMNTWGINQLRCTLNGNNAQALPLETFCPY